MIVPHTKLEAVLAIVDWEHRYKYKQLQGGGYCIERIRELMGQSRTEVAAKFAATFGVPMYGRKPRAEAIGRL